MMKFLRGEFTARQQLGDEKRKKFASLCDAISKVLERFIETKEDRRQSINLCAELREYVVPIRDIASGTLASDDINRLATELNGICDAWSNLASAAELGHHSYEVYLDQLEEGGRPVSRIGQRIACEVTQQWAHTASCTRADTGVG